MYYTRLIARLIIRLRIPICLMALILTIFFIYETFKVSSKHDLYELVPQAHPYVKLNRHIEEVFGGVNLVANSAIIACCSSYSNLKDYDHYRPKVKKNFLDILRTYRLMVEFINIRERCAWICASETEKAEARAKDFIGKAVARLIEISPRRI